jgi:isopenicillin-N epimerase
MASALLNRRSFLRAAGGAGAVGFAARGRNIERVLAASDSVAGRTPEEVAKDDFYWRQIQMDFELDRTIINLNNGYTCPTSRMALESEFRYLRMIEEAPIFYEFAIADRIETIRLRMAKEFGCDPEEMALTRGASESLQIVQNGIDLKPGDEVVTTDQDYPRMLTTWDQRMRRDGIKVHRLQFPVPTTGDDLYQRFEQAITPRTKVFHFCHVTNLTAQLFPVQRLCRLARSKGIVSIVDGAHALGHFPFKLRDLECDAYGVSLHKWLLAPIGNGCLYVRKEMIPKFWPMQAAAADDDDNIRKFEQIGTTPLGVRAALGEALAYHQAIGPERKAARLRYLTLRWANALKVYPRIKIYTDLSEPPQAWALAAVYIDGIDVGDLSKFLLDKYRIIVVGLKGGKPPSQVFDYQCLRVSPNIYTTLEEIDTFVAAMEEAMKNGVPASSASSSNSTLRQGWNA